MATESWVVAGPQIIDIETITSLQVQMVAGRVDVVAHEDPTATGARIEVHSITGRPLEISWSDGHVQVGYRFMTGTWDGFLQRFRNMQSSAAAEVHIAVPRSIAAKVATVSAEGLLSGVTEDASVSTVSGSLVTDGTRGLLGVNVVSGEVAVRDHAGDLRLKSVSGDVTASGRLSRVSASTVSGRVTLDSTAGSSSFTVQSVSGDVTVRLPEGLGLSVDARSVSGRVVVDGEERGSRSPGQVTVDMRSADATCFVSVKTVSGHLTVLRGAGAL
ncbi:DUF4097 family beta strand repeat-containing protein [Cellulomonas hominis]